MSTRFDRNLGTALLLVLVAAVVLITYSCSAGPAPESPNETYTPHEIEQIHDYNKYVKYSFQLEENAKASTEWGDSLETLHGYIKNTTGSELQSVFVVICFYDKDDSLVNTQAMFSLRLAAYGKWPITINTRNSKSYRIKTLFVQP